MGIASFLNRKLLKLDEEILRDEAKYTMMVGDMLLFIVNLWPEKFGMVTKISFSVMFTTCATMEISLLMHLFTTMEGFNSLTKVISSIAVCLQCMTKMSIVVFRWKSLSTIIKTVWYEFWPSHALGLAVQDDIKNDSKRLLIGFLTVYATGCLFLLLLILAPAIDGVRKLPYSTWYPFEWTTSPIYEMLYTIQVYVAIYIIANCVCGYDFLYCSLCANCVAQFRLLDKAVIYIGSGKEAALTDFLLRIPGVSYDPVLGITYEDERKLLVICVKHHQKLIRLCYQLNDIFSYGHCVQLAASVMAICVSCFLITIENRANEITFLLSYYIAHVTQLLVFCAVSDELTHWSTCLSKSAFQSLWYLKEYGDIRKCLSVIIMRSQRAIPMHAFWLFKLSYASFLTAMRFTFSLYTLLSKMAKK